MRPFNFLTQKNQFNGFTFEAETIQKVYDICQEYYDFIEECRRNYLNEHPQTDPDDTYAFPIPNESFYYFVAEGKLWHGGSDYDEREEKLTHYVYIDSLDMQNDFFFEVEETDAAEFKILNVEKDDSRFRDREEEQQD